MHPAASVIIFNTFSGLGFGLLFWLGMGAMFQRAWVPSSGSPSPISLRWAG